MKTLAFSSEDNEVYVEYLVDAISPDAENLTIMEVRGVDTAYEKAALNFKALPSTRKAFVDFAAANSLKLVSIDSSKAEEDVVVLQDFPTTTTTTEEPTTTTTTTEEP